MLLQMPQIPTKGRECCHDLYVFTEEEGSEKDVSSVHACVSFNTIE